jgi:hypothetical protein
MPFESRINNVNPIPRRGAFTGVAGSDGLDDGPEVPGFSVFSGGLPGLFGPGAVLVRLRLGLAAVPVFAGFALGRVVRKAPRTSSSCVVAAIPIATPQKQTNAKTMTLSRITESPYCSLVNPV